MIEFQQKRILRNRLYSRLSFIILLIIVLVLAKAVFNIYRKSAVAKQNSAQAAKVLNDLEERREFLSQNIARLNTDAGVEEEIRNKFQMAKDGESMILLVGEDKASTTEIKDRSFLDWLKGFFGN